MTIYLVIGLIVEVAIIILRRCLNKSDWSNITWQVWLCILVGSAINILVWPITIICEVFNTVKRV